MTTISKYIVPLLLMMVALPSIAENSGTDSYAMQVLKAANIRVKMIKDSDLKGSTMDQKAYGRSATGHGIDALSGLMNGGVDGLFGNLGLGLLVSSSNSIPMELVYSPIAWMPEGIASDKNEAFEEYEKIFTEALVKGLEDADYEIREIRNKGRYKQIMISGDGCSNNECRVGITLNEKPKKKKLPNLISNDGKAWTFKSKRNTYGFFTGDKNNGTFEITEMIKIIAHVSNHCPDWMYLYSSIKEPKNRKKFIPIIFNDGKLHYFVKGHTKNDGYDYIFNNEKDNKNNLALQ